MPANRPEDRVFSETGTAMVMNKVMLFICFALVSACARATDTDLSVEQEKQAITKFMQEHAFKPGTFKDPKLCAAFFQDFKRQTNIEYVRPIVETHDYFDPALQKYLKQCPKMELRTPVSGRSGAYVGTPTLKLFKVDIDNNPGNGKEFLFLEAAFERRAGRASNYEPGIVGNTTYQLVDLNACATRATLYVGAHRSYRLDTDLSKERPDTSYHDVIKYRGKYYVYDVIRAQGYSRPFSLYQYRNEDRRFFPICSFTR